MDFVCIERDDFSDSFSLMVFALGKGFKWIKVVKGLGGSGMTLDSEIRMPGFESRFETRTIAPHLAWCED